AFAAGADGFGAEHEAREIDVQLVRRRVGALHVAELALVAEVDDLPLLVARERLGLALAADLVLVDGVGERRKRRAIVEAHAAAVTDVEHAPELAIERLVVVEARIPEVEGHGVAPNYVLSPNRVNLRGGDAARRRATDRCRGACREDGPDAAH